MACSADPWKPPEPTAESLPELAATVTLTGASGSIDVQCRVRSTPSERAVGLMYRKEPLGDAIGMLFLMDRDEDHSFWMKNTFIPLDMLFIQSDGEIAGIVHSAAPRTTRSRSVGRPSRFVLELDGGWAGRHDISTGDTAKILLHDGGAAQPPQ